MTIRGDMFSLAEASVFIPQIWSTDIMRYRLEDLVFARYVKRIPFSGRAGDLIKLPRISRLGVNTKSLKTPIEYQSVTDTEWEMTITRYQYSAIMVEDIVEIQAHTSLRQEYTREISRALARDLDLAVQAERAAIIGADSTHHVTSTAPISKAEILAAIEILDRERVPADGRVLIVSPAHYASLLAIDQFVNADYVSGQPTVTGRIGTIYGIPIVVSNYLGINSTTGLYNGDNDPAPSPTPGMTGSLYYPDQEDGTVTSLTANYYSAVMLHRDCIALAMQKMPSVTSAWDIDHQATKVASTQLYGVKLFRPSHGVVISTDEDGLV